MNGVRRPGSAKLEVKGFWPTDLRVLISATLESLRAPPYVGEASARMAFGLVNRQRNEMSAPVAVRVRVDWLQEPNRCLLACTVDMPLIRLNTFSLKFSLPFSVFLCP